jgi:hypothetical protein
MSQLPSTLEGFYDLAHSRPTAMAPHLPRIRALASGLELAVEFGVKRGASSSALLLGSDHVISYDIVATPQARHLERLAGRRWEYRLQDTRTAPVTPCDLLLVDSLHTFAQVDAELRRHADAVRRFLVFHDTLTFGSVGADGETGQQIWAYRPGVSVPLCALGIRPAIDDLMIRDPTWRIVASYADSHGLLVLERRA